MVTENFSLRLLQMTSVLSLNLISEPIRSATTRGKIDDFFFFFFTLNLLNLTDR